MQLNLFRPISLSLQSFPNDGEWYTISIYEDVDKRSNVTLFTPTNCPKDDVLALMHAIRKVFNMKSDESYTSPEHQAIRELLDHYFRNGYDPTTDGTLPEFVTRAADLVGYQINDPTDTDHVVPIDGDAK
jgi:hypothetical protein